MEERGCTLRVKDNPRQIRWTRRSEAAIFVPGLDKSSKKAREREKKAKERERKREARILTLRELFSFAEIKHCRREELSRRIRAETKKTKTRKRNTRNERMKKKKQDWERKRKEGRARAGGKKFESFQIRERTSEVESTVRFRANATKGLSLTGSSRMY